jgi:hypothetical protein
MSTPGQSRLSVRQALRDRCLTVASGDDGASLARYLDPARGGLVVSSTKGISGARALHAALPGLVLAADPKERDEQAATVEAPIALPPGDMFGETTLDEVINGQFASGADIGVIPGRYVHAEDSDSLRALIEMANALDRDDVILRVPCAYPWARPESTPQLITLFSRSRHPVALSLGDRADPLEQKGVPAGLRTIVDSYPGLIIWKTDLAGLDAIARGALAAAIGILPSLRHACPPGGPGRAIDKTDKTPRIFLPRLLRYVRGSYLHDEWFASVEPWTCDCIICDGRAIDRFTGSKDDLLQASRHNAIAITELHRELTAEAAGYRQDLWREKLQDAELAHRELSHYIERDVPFHKVLQFWLDHS